MSHIVGSRQIGEKIRELRKSLGISQEKLGELMGVSFQQIQKYEKGVSKLSPERMQQLAAALNVPVITFFQLDDKKARATGQKAVKTMAGVSLSKEEREIIRHFQKITNPGHRSIAVSLVKTIASFSGKRK